jgi:hypothetical protein
MAVAVVKAVSDRRVSPVGNNLIEGVHFFFAGPLPASTAAELQRA